MSAAKTRIYAITDQNGHTRLVRATTTAQGLRHVAKDEYSVKVATQDELVALVSDGVKVEESTASKEE